MKICRCQSIVSTKHDTTILQIPFVLRNLRKCDSAPVLLPSGQFQVRVTSVPVLRWLPIGVTSEVTSSGKSGGSHGVAFVGGCEVKTRLSVRVIKPHNNQSCWGLWYHSSGEEHPSATNETEPEHSALVSQAHLVQSVWNSFVLFRPHISSLEPFAGATSSRSNTFCETWIHFSRVVILVKSRIKHLALLVCVIWFHPRILFQKHHQSFQLLKIICENYTFSKSSASRHKEQKQKTILLVGIVVLNKTCTQRDTFIWWCQWNAALPYQCFLCQKHFMLAIVCILTKLLWVNMPGKRLQNSGSPTSKGFCSPLFMTPLLLKLAWWKKGFLHKICHWWLNFQWSTKICCLFCQVAEFCGTISALWTGKTFGSGCSCVITCLQIQQFSH